MRFKVIDKVPNFVLGKSKGKKKAERNFMFMEGNFLLYNFAVKYPKNGVLKANGNIKIASFLSASKMESSSLSFTKYMYDGQGDSYKTSLIMCIPETDAMVKIALAFFDLEGNGVAKTNFMFLDDSPAADFLSIETAAKTIKMFPEFVNFIAKQGAEKIIQMLKKADDNIGIDASDSNEKGNSDLSVVDPHKNLIMPSMLPKIKHKGVYSEFASLHTVLESKKKPKTSELLSIEFPIASNSKEIDSANTLARVLKAVMRLKLAKEIEECPKTNFGSFRQCIIIGHNLIQQNT